MRRSLLAALTIASAWACLQGPAAYAQSPDDQQRQQQQDDLDEMDRRRRDWDNVRAPLPENTNAGPCPYVKILYDAARTIDFKGAENAANVVNSGEIEGVAADCTYRGADPIEIDMMITFSLGRGPQATSPVKDFGYWVAVTDRNRAVLSKEQFGVRAVFPVGQNRVVQVERISGIVIPRAAETVSGENFEVLIGFNMTPEMAAFNREGKRFRVDADGSFASAQETPAPR